METPNLLDSKIKPLLIELPHFNYGHSSNDSENTFVGRKKLISRLKELVKDTNDKTGVYLITGHRGVGKSRLVNKVIKETSLTPDSFNTLKYLFFLLLAIAGTQLCIISFPINTHTKHWTFGILCVISSCALYYLNGHRRKNILQNIANTLKEISSLKKPLGPYSSTQYLLRIIFIVSFIQIIHFNPITLTICLLLAILMNFYPFRKFKKIKFIKKIFCKISDYIEGHNRVYLRINFGHKLRDEKDILRLIVRTFSTEYHKYLCSFWRRPFWLIISIVFLFIFASFLGKSVSNLDLYKTTTTQIKKSKVNSEYIFCVENVASLLVAADSLISETTNRIKHLPKYLWNHTKPLASDNDDCVNYSLLLSFIFLYLCFVLLFRSRLLMPFFITHRIIIRQLKKLNSDITHSTERESSINIPNSSLTDKIIGMRTKKSRGIADAREIEKELQDIFENVKRIPVIMGRPKFVIIFDELDKVEPGESNSENANYETKAALFSIEATRERQSEILKIMSNMKYFLSTSEAKYIFIAGREMYDIYLADVSDRNNYVGSIFSTVIEVPSFLSDHAKKKNKSDMTSLTEEFICRRLIPCDYSVEKDSYNLETYRKYLKKKIYKTEEDIEEIHKIIAVLQHFVVYLAHISKGAPKKMMQLFESFIKICNKKEKNKDKYLKVQYYKKSRFFLNFDYYKQYTLGILAYLITPIFNRLVEVNLSTHNDKLLVSALRFVDFVFKFHKHSFSWKHLDISPEMLEVNKSPELKPIIIELFNYIAQVHITRSNFSLFDYRFDNLIANEIFASTKTDEVISALFSFSLDETLSLKKRYKDLLEKIQKEYQHDKNFSSTKFIDAISSLQIVLGDLHYFDEELEEAGTYYRDAVEGLRNFDSKNDDDKGRMYGYNKKHKDEDGEDRRDLETMNPEQLYTYIRNMLKIGMIYEKREQPEFAYLIYGEICRRIIRERNIAVNELGAGIAVRKVKNDEHAFVKVRSIDKITEKYNDNVEYPSLSCGEKVEYDTAQPQPLYFQRISPNTNDMLFRKMTYEGLKLLYMPFIAKLQILEKSHMGGITRTHLEQLDKEFELLTFIIDHEEANILEADFYSRVADVMYYKNSDLKGKFGKNRLEDKDEDKYIDEKEKSCECNWNYKNNSCTACYYYHKALFRLLNKIYKEEEIKKKIKETTLIELLCKSTELLNDKHYNVKFYTVLARILSDWGNVFFSCDKKNKNNENCYIGNEKIFNTRRHCYNCSCYICELENCRTYHAGTILEKYFNNYIEFESIENNKQTLLNAFKSGKYFLKMEIAFAMYAISFQAFRKANLNKRAAYQIYKMLRLFKCYNINEKKYNLQLSQKAISLLLFATDNLNIHELNKRKKDFGKEMINDEIPLQYLLVDSDITMIRILVKELELKSDKTPLSEFYNLSIASPYGIFCNLSARIFQLRLKSYVNYEAYKKLIPANIYDDLGKELEFIFNKKINKNIIKEIFGEQYTENDVFENLIAESIFLLKEIIRLSKTLGETYLFNHSFMGLIHNNLSFWIMRYETYKKYYYENDSDTSRIDNLLKHHLGNGYQEQLSAHYENKQSLSHYYKCLETHSEGKAYHVMIDEMYYVKDDFNDRSDHFSIALERHKILNGKIDEKIKALKEHYKDSASNDSDPEISKLYKLENYFAPI